MQSVDGSPHTIVRTKTKQRENVNGSVTELDIKWTGDCTYLLYNWKVVEGADDKSTDGLTLDTLYNEIVEVVGNKHRVVSTMRGYDMKVEATLVKADTALLYREFNELPQFMEYGDEAYGGIMMDDNYSLAYKRKAGTKNNYLIVFEEAYSINLRSKFKLLDTAGFTLVGNQSITAGNCRFNDQYDPEIVVVYSSRNDNKEAEIYKAWRFNRTTLRIETVDAKKVKYTKADNLRLNR